MKYISKFNTLILSSFFLAALLVGCGMKITAAGFSKIKLS